LGDITDGQTEIEFLANKSSQGKLVIVTGTANASGVIASYTPVNGSTFILYKAILRLQPTAANRTCTAQLRNNGTVLDTIYGSDGSGVPSNAPFIIKGDQLIGNGSKSYDINISAVSGTPPQMVGTIIGYLL